jgi:hypothetical protein
MNNSLTLIVFCDPYGKIFYVSESFYGCLNSINSYERTRIDLLLKENEYLMLDLGYYGLNFLIFF